MASTRMGKKRRRSAEQSTSRTYVRTYVAWRRLVTLRSRLANKAFNHTYPEGTSPFKFIPLRAAQKSMFGEIQSIGREYLESTVRYGGNKGELYGYWTTVW